VQPETEALVSSSQLAAPSSQLQTGRLSFVETISVLNRQPADLVGATIRLSFSMIRRCSITPCPSAQVDPRSGVICMPNNFDFGAGRTLPEGIFRVTCLASYDCWADLPEEQYQTDKLRWFTEVQRSAQRFLPPLSAADTLAAATIATDMFTPRTIREYTGHFGGAIYGAPRKHRQGRTELDNLYLCGTDQGFLGIVGAMLSGISMRITTFCKKTRHASRDDARANRQGK